MNKDVHMQEGKTGMRRASGASVVKKTILSLLAVCALLVGAGSALAQSIVVLPFTINAAPEQAAALNQQLPDLLRQSLGAYGFNVLSASNTTRVAGSSPVMDADRARTLAAQGGVEFAVFGTLNQIGSSFNIDLRLVQVGTSLLRPFTAEGASLDALPAAANSLAARLGSAAVSKNAIADIQVRGLLVMDQDRVLVNSYSRVGDLINMDNIDADLRRIWASGNFEDVSVSIEEGSQGNVLVFSVVEKARVDEVIVQGNHKIKLKDINEVLTARAGGVLNEREVRADVQRIRGLYLDKGYYLAEVNYEVQPNQTGGVSLLINIEEGNRLYVRSIDIVGLEELDRKGFNDYLSMKRRNFLSWFTGSGLLKADQLERDTQAIQAYMINQGYLDSTVSQPEVIYEPDGIRVVYNVTEGRRYAVGEVGFRGELIADEATLYGVVGMDEQRDKNTYFSLEVLQNDVQALTNYYNDQGYAFANVDVVTDGDRAGDAIVHIYYTLTPNEKVYVRRVLVEGNTDTRDNVILREMRLADGQEFSGDDLRYSLQRLDRLQYFSTIETELIPTGNPGEVDLKLIVEEANTGMAMLGFGYSTWDGFGVSGSVEESNLFGRGYDVNLSAYISKRELSFNLSFYNPRIYNTHWGAGLSLYAIEEEWSNYDKRTIGGRVSLGHPIGNYSNISFSYRLDYYTLFNFTEDFKAANQPFVDQYSGGNWSSVATIGFGRDTTNRTYNPTRGTRAALSLSYGGGYLQGDDNFIKVNGSWGFFFGLNDNNILHARVTAALAFQNQDNKIPSFEMYYPGGMNSIRGFTVSDLAPYVTVVPDPSDLSKNYTYIIGADRMAYASLEYIWAFAPNQGLAIVPFFDIGVVSNHYTNHEGFFDNLYYSAGLELRWRSPMGDLRFAYAFPLTDNVMGERRKSGRFEFTMGTAF